METTFTGDAEAGEVFFDLEDTITGFQVPISFQLNAPDSNAISMTYMQHRDFFQRYPDPTAAPRATPSIWSMFGTTLVIGPAPLDQTYTFQLLYIKEPTLLASDGVFDVPNAFSELLVLGMLSRAQALNDQYDLSQVTSQEFDIQFQIMQQRLLRRQTEGGSRMNRRRAIR